MADWVRADKTPPGRIGWLFKSKSGAEPWPENANHCPRCRRPIPGSYYHRAAGPGGPISLTPTGAELIQRCLVDGPRGHVEVPESHDASWILAETTSLAPVLRAHHERHWSRVVATGSEQARDGSWEYLGHGLVLLKSMGPAWLDKDRLESVIVAIRRYW